MTTKPYPHARIIDEGVERGLRWVTAAAPLAGAVNGYVELPEDHPWLGHELQSLEGPDIDVHGDITFGPTTERWIGFDTLHAGDVWPSGPDTSEETAMVRSMLAAFEMRGTASRTWTTEAVAEETRKLAVQAAEAVNS